MKRVTASDARRNWFRLLDEVAAGEVVSIERGGRTILIQRSDAGRAEARTPDYASLLSAPDAAEADAWGWVWDAASPDLTFIREGEVAASDEGDATTVDRARHGGADKS